MKNVKGDKKSKKKVQKLTKEELKAMKGGACFIIWGAKKDEKLA